MSDLSGTGPVGAGPVGAGVTVEGVAAAIPAALIAALFGGQRDLSDGEPLTVDARGLRLTVPGEAAAAGLTALLPGRGFEVSFEDGALLVRSDATPPVRIVLPEGGLRLSVSPAGLAIGD